MPTIRLLLLAFAVFALAGPAAAQPAPQRVRGTIERLEGHVLTVKTREGPSVAVNLAEGAAVNAVVPVTLESIAPGSYIGTASVAQPDGSYRALEVLVFPEAARGVSEGKFPWDLTPESTMINATVATVAAVGAAEGGGHTLSLTHKGGTDKVVVPPGVPIVTFQPADRSLLQPGAAVFIVAQKSADGGLAAARVAVGKDGTVPPM